MLAGILAALLMGFFAVTLGVNQHVAGLGITLLCTSLALFSFRLLFGSSSVLPSVDPFPQVSFMNGIPVLGPIFEQYLLTYLALLVVAPLAWWLIYRTRFGLNLRTVGENPEAADAAGVSVARTRYLALALGGALMGDGRRLSVAGAAGRLLTGIIAGRGWVCIALVIFARWDPVRAVWGALLFGGVYACSCACRPRASPCPSSFSWRRPTSSRSSPWPSRGGMPCIRVRI